MFLVFNITQKKKKKKESSSDLLLEMAGSLKRTVSFCKHFCPETSSQKMEIPISFKESVGGVIPKNVMLSNCFEKNWSMEITETRDGLHFQNGWAKFVKDNSITNGDCLVFFYHGYGLFDFFLYDQSGCEKIVVIDAQTQVNKKLKEEEEEDDVVVANDDDTDNDDDGCDDEDDSDFVTEDDMNEVEGEEDDEDVKAYMLGFTNSKRNRNNACGSKKGTGAGAREGSSSKKNKDVLDHFGAELFTSGQYIQPKNPYFVTKLGPKNRGSLYIPVDVIKDHNIALPPTLILRDARGQEWKAKVKIWRDGRTWLSGGWQSLCRWNLVDKDDRCICEFVRPRTNDMFLQVTIVRGQAAKSKE